MTTATLNGHDALTLPTIEAPDVAADLDQWDSLICELDDALLDASAARQAMDTEARTLECIEAGHVLSIDGGNAEQRKGRLTLTVADDVHYQDARSRHHAAHQHLMDAERRVTVSRERCRLLRTALMLHAVGNGQ